MGRDVREFLWRNDILRAELADYRTSSGALRFAIDTPLPKALIQRLILTRMERLGIR